MFSRSPGPQRYFAPIAVGCQVRHRVIAAPQTILAAIFADRFVIGRVKTSQIAQEMADKPGERLRFTQPADGHFKVVAAPTSLQAAAAGGQPFPEQRRALDVLHHLRPVFGDKRLEVPRLRQLRRSLRQGLEALFIPNRVLLIGRFSGRVIKGYFLYAIAVGIRRIAPIRQRECGRFDGVVVHHQVQRRHLGSGSKTIQSKVLDPNSRMENLGLMTGSQECADEEIDRARPGQQDMPEQLG